MRDELPTLPCDLSEYARVNTGTFDAADADGEDPTCEIDLRPLSVRVHEVPRLALSPDECMTLGLNHREGFVLGLLDGCSTIEEIVEIAGLPESETLDTLSDLCVRGAIRLSPRPHA